MSIRSASASLPQPLRRLGATPPALVGAGILVSALMLVPIGYLILRAGEIDRSGWDLILRDRTVWLALRTIGLALAVTSCAIAIALPAAWLTTRTDLPGRRVWSVVLALPLVIPSYVGAFALLSALGPRGMLQRTLAPLGVESVPDISGFFGAFLALTLFTYPYVFLLVGAAMRGLDPALEEAARSLGHSRWQTYKKVTLPLLRPSIAAGGLLVALYTLHDFGAVSLMRFPAFTQAIYLQYKGAFDRAPAALLSLMLVAFAAVVLVLEMRARGRARYHRSGVGSQRPLPPVPLNRWRAPAIAFCALVTAVALILPLGVVGYWFGRAVSSGDALRITWSAAGSSVVASALGAAAALAMAAPVAFAAARYPGPASRRLELLSYSGYALPGLVAALALVFFSANYLPGIYQSLPLVVIAYVILFLPQAVEPLRSSLLQISPVVEEAGRSLGKTRAHMVRRVTLPLVSRGAVAGAALVFLTAMKELPATLLLRPTGFETLATRIWGAASAGLYSRAAAPALLLILVCCVPLYLVARRTEVEEVEVRAE